MQISVKSREVTVTGKRGTLKREFKHMALDIIVAEDGRSIKVDLWFGARDTIAAIRCVLKVRGWSYFPLIVFFLFSFRTICSHIENMIKGVTKGFKYTMRFCYAHFPINVTCVKEGSSDVVEIRNFLGEKRTRKVQLLDGVTYFRSPDVKDQIEISGNDITKVSLACARISQATNVRNKDIRKFLDGIYVSTTGFIESD